MKRTIPILLVITACLAAITSFSQNATDDKKHKTCKVKVMTTNTNDDNSTSVSKVITVDDNGKKKMVITTTKDGETSVEELTDDEVDKYMEDNDEVSNSFMNGFIMKSNGDADVEVDVDVEQMMKEAGVEISEDKDGEKKVIIKSCNGNNYSYNYNFDSDENDAQKVVVKAYSMGGDSNDKNATVIKDKRVYEDVEDIEKLLEELEIEIDDKNEITDGKKRVVVKKIVRIEDIEESETTEKANELKENPALFIAYPNPTSGKFTVEFNNSSKKAASITVTDSNGKLVHKQKIKGEGKQAAIVNLDEAKKGVYFITVTEGEESSTQKIMVE